MRARNSRRRASPKPSAARAGIGRRGLLLGGGRVALGALLLPACAEPPVPAAAPAADAQPWSDGTWFDDGTGWIT